MLPFFGIAYTTFLAITGAILYAVVRRFHVQYQQGEIRLIQDLNKARSSSEKEKIIPSNKREMEESLVEKSFNYSPAGVTMDIGFENLGLKSKRYQKSRIC